ncbi:MAG: MBOAT family protein [Gemmatimonadota bacterium]
MLFNSHGFLFVFLPLALLGFFALGRRRNAAGIAWLALVSLGFYAYWNPRYVALLVASAAFNYSLGATIARAGAGTRRAFRWLTLAVIADLALLAYYKYAAFFISTADALGMNWTIPHIILPLGISFFTFTQIAYLVDTYRGKTSDDGFVNFLLFVTYFPHLIAGPVLHHAEMMPQFRDGENFKPRDSHFAVGLTILAIGLFKKVILADGVGAFVTPVFDAARSDPYGFLEAWGGALAYTLQLYFDFSGYSDMAIGISRMFGIVLPLNFASPYKSPNIIEFWRRWHMTLSRFLRDYLYIPLGGGRRGPVRRYTNLFITMVLGGLWHGAGWTFVLWGALHGGYLMVNHGWRGLVKSTGGNDRGAISRIAGGALTFLAVVIAWVFFRAPSVSVALEILRGMCGANGLDLPPRWLAVLTSAGIPLREWGVTGSGLDRFGGIPQVVWIMTLLAVVWLLPNTQEFMRNYRPALDAPDSNTHAGAIVWTPTAWWAVVLACAAVVAVASMTRISTFLYYQF